MIDYNEDMKGYMALLAKKGRGYSDMMTIIVDSLGGIETFNEKYRKLAIEGADSSDVCLTDDAIMAIYTENKELILEHAEHLSLLLNCSSVTDMMIDSDWSGWVVDFGSTRLSRALFEKENEGHASAVSYLVKYLAQQLCVGYVVHLNSINGAVTNSVKSYLENADDNASAMAKLLIAHYGNELNFSQKYPTIAEKGVGIRWTEFTNTNALALYDSHRKTVLAFASDLAQKYGHTSIAQLLTYTEYNRRGWIGMDAETINCRLYDPTAENRAGVICQLIKFINDEVNEQYMEYLDSNEVIGEL